jgi:BlaI family transcriptional regulator, penicillinase repressor
VATPSLQLKAQEALMPTKPARPTDAELRILRVLWDRGPSTVREVHDALQEERVAGYTTALKMLQVMTAKGLVERDDRQRPQRFAAARARAATQRQLLRDLADRAFGGSAGALVLRALPDVEITDDERVEIERLLESGSS